MPCREPLGKAVKRRSTAGGKPPKTRARQAVTSKRGGAPGAVRRRNSYYCRLQYELDRRTPERDEAIEQQTATSVVLRVITSSPGDLEPVFEAMLENAVRICDSKFGNIYRWDGEALHLLAAHNTPPVIVEHRRRTALPSSCARSCGSDDCDETVVHIADLQQNVTTLSSAIRQLRRSRSWRRTDTSGSPDAEGQRTDRFVHSFPPGSSPIYG